MIWVETRNRASSSVFGQILKPGGVSKARKQSQAGLPEVANLWKPNCLETFHEVKLNVKYYYIIMKLSKNRKYLG